MGLGQFMAGDLNSHDQVSGLFTNFTWTKPNLTVQEAEVIGHWRTPYTGVFCSLAGFALFNVNISSMIFIIFKNIFFYIYHYLFFWFFSFFFQLFVQQSQCLQGALSLSLK